MKVFISEDQMSILQRIEYDSTSNTGCPANSEKKIS